jgi:hypothetical protein
LDEENRNKPHITDIEAAFSSSVIFLHYITYNIANVLKIYTILQRSERKQKRASINKEELETRKKQKQEDKWKKAGYTSLAVTISTNLFVK